MISSLLIAASLVGPSSDGMLARMRARQGAFRTMSASIEQVKSYPQLGMKDPVERGRLYLERGAEGRSQLRLEITSPEVRILVAKDGGYLLYQPRIKQAVTGSLNGGGSKGLFSGVLAGSTEAARQLDRDYRHEELGDGHLRFVANPGAAVHCQTIDLWLDTETWLPTRQSCREANQSVITISLGDVQVDDELPDRIFEVEIPDGVQRIKGP